MNEIESQDRHQYIWMMKTLEAYQEGQINLGTLINTLENYHNTLQLKTDTWNKLFFRNWGQLEVVYSVAIQHKPFHLDEHDQTTIASAIAALKDMLRPRLDDEQD